jgi:hypothetical protein
MVLIFTPFIFGQDTAVKASKSNTGKPVATANVKEKSKENQKINYQYKKEEYFDFEALSVKGDLLNPMDLSNKANKRMRFNRGDYIRKNFDDFTYRELLEVY